MSVVSAFAPLTDGKNRFTRRWGANNGSAVDPYISGYFFIKFNNFPKNISTTINNSGLGHLGLSDGKMQNLLESSCQSVTIPGATVNKTEFPGLGGIRFHAVTNVEWDNTVSMRFLEFAGAPVHAIFHGWAKMMRDYRSGVSHTLSGSGNDVDAYSKKNYATSAYYWTTREDGVTIQFASCMTGLFPMRDPTEQFGHDLTTIDKLEIEMEFNCDVLYQEAWVREHVRNLAIEIKNEGITKSEEYGRNDAGLS